MILFVLYIYIHFFVLILIKSFCGACVLFLWRETASEFAAYRLAYVRNYTRTATSVQATVVQRQCRLPIACCTQPATARVCVHPATEVKLDADMIGRRPQRLSINHARFLKASNFVAGCERSRCKCLSQHIARLAIRKLQRPCRLARPPAICARRRTNSPAFVCFV